MKELQKAAYLDIKKNASNFSIRAVIDLALMVNHKSLIFISENQYIDLIGSFGLLLENPKIVLIGYQQAQELSPPGFYSIYDRLMDKVSLCLYNDFLGAQVVLCVKHHTSVSYKKTVKKIIVDETVGFESCIRSLKDLGYQRTKKVEEIKQFCVKGGIVDFYSPLYKNPVRSYFYDDLTKFVYYNLSTGLPKKQTITKIELNKQAEEKVLLDIKKSLLSFGFQIVDASVFNNTKQGLMLTEVPERVFNKNNKNISYVDKLLFSAYKLNKQIYAPIAYKNTISPDKEQGGFVVGFEPGDLVCHEDFGVGRFIGFGSSDPIDGEFVKIQYLDGSVNLSVNKIFKLSFVSRETKEKEKVASLNKKGAWKRKEGAVSRVAQKYVNNLVNMYVNKESLSRSPFVFGGNLEDAFIKAFQYVETRDQGCVWGEIKKDLEDDKPMSRLLCGDVGFGKTELAMRALFRVVVNGGRGVVLCPTSVLANQHLEVFLDRFSSFGVNVSVLVGGLSVEKKNKVKLDWVEKKIDILIATSAALYDDVFVRFASLFVVDEEHRFGVKQKEVLVNKFVNKDVLFMSATPIPRTLHLSLSGFHNISTLSTPPLLRKPINTIVSYFSENLIKQNINFELSRGGQVFYLHNRISSILSVKAFLMKLCPSLKVAVVHSKLGNQNIKKVVDDFINKKYNLLLCSSVIGSGVDIPNANTIFIDNAHLFGLSQLHQIRGRVGRGGAQGFAYLLVPEHRALTESGKKRLKTIEQNTSLGSGYNLSKKDLEIRGGGTVFGYKQSGALFDVGYEYYSKIVSRCFDNKTKNFDRAKVDSFGYQVVFPCSFSKTYITLNYDRLKAYRELSGLYSVGSVKSFKERLVQVYGAFSVEEDNLLNMRLVSLFCGALNIDNLTYNKGGLVLFFNNTFTGLDYLVKFLGLYKIKFNILSFVFGASKKNTTLSVCFEDNVKVDGLFLKCFIGDFDVFCKK